jgi:hypothetical protein
VLVEQEVRDRQVKLGFQEVILFFQQLPHQAVAVAAPSMSTETLVDLVEGRGVIMQVLG